MSLSAEYSKINPYEAPCNARKKYAPFKCEFVPKEYLKTVVAKYPKLCEFVFWTCHLNWMKENRTNYRGNRLQVNKKWWLHPLSVKLQGIIQRELNYERSTFVSGHILHRFGAIYRHMNGYSWHYEDAFGQKRTLVFTKFDIEIDRILDR